VTSTAEQAPAAGTAVAEAARRRTFAVISHPDAGKSTLTEALALHARVIQEAGAIHGKAGRKSTVSDWMDMEKARGISISSAALQFGYGDTVVNLVDTPGHADFSEDTYRVLAAVDSAVMLLDAAKGLEPQTMKLFDVCRHRGIPVLTVVNKWDRPGLEALQLMDEIRDRTGLEPTPLTWPVGIAGDFRGVLERSSGDFIRFTRTAGGATVAPEERPAPPPRRATRGRRRWRSPRCSTRWVRCTTRTPSSPALRRPCCSARRCSTSAYASCSTSCSRSRHRPARARTRRVRHADSTHRSARSCSRSRRAWTATTATAWRTCGSARVCSSAAPS
jgi:small GTP-binding protein